MYFEALLNGLSPLAVVFHLPLMAGTLEEAHQPPCRLCWVVVDCTERRKFPVWDSPGSPTQCFSSMSSGVII